MDESKERLRSAFASSKLDLPKKRITINLAPADIPKDSTSFDLPTAAAILYASGQVAQPPAASSSFIGELGLDGSVRGVRGIIGKLLALVERKNSLLSISRSRIWNRLCLSQDSHWFQ